jgi:hypothetical protein
VMLVSVHDVSCDTPGMMSYRILRATIRTKWIVHAPVMTMVSAAPSRQLLLLDRAKSRGSPAGGPATTASSVMRTFSIDPVRVEVRQRRLIAQLLDRLRRLMVNLEDATRSPPSSTFVRHVRVDASTRWVGARVVRDGARDKEWGRQLGGVVGVCRRGLRRVGRCVDGRAEVGTIGSHDARAGDASREV